MNLPPYLSHTQLMMHRMCQTLYQFHYIDKIMVPVSGEVVRGGAYHKALEFAYRIKALYNEIPTQEAVEQIFSDEWNKSLSNRIVWDEDGDISIASVDFGDKNPGQLKGDGLYLLRMYYNGLYQKIIPREVEVKKTVEYNGITLLGFLDVITIDNQVIDHKFTSRAYSEAQIQTNTQSSFYGLLLGEDEIDFHIHQAIARNRPDIVDIPIKRTRDDLDWMGDLVCKTWAQIQSGLFVPNPHGWWCGPDECKYWPYCRMPRRF